jgi:hypothetical protein
VLLLLAAPAHLGCFASSALDSAAAHPAGTINLVSGSLGNHVLVPTVCTSGERQVFLGADFVDGQRGLTTRLIIDPAGSTSVRVFVATQPLDQGLVFRRSDCSRFELSLERTGWRINDIYDLRVSLEVACRSTSGDSIDGKLDVSHCH